MENSAEPIFKMALAAMLDFPRSDNYRYTTANICKFPPSWIFWEVKSEGKTDFGTSFLVSVPNFVGICSTVTEVWPLKKNFKMATAAILDFVGIEF